MSNQYNTDPKKGGIKHDQGKNRLELVPPEAIEAIGRVLTHGANKYEDRNWEKGMPLERVYGACQRHLQRWASGVDLDPDSGLPHLEHALCNLAMMVALRGRGPVVTIEYKQGLHPREEARQALRDYVEKNKHRQYQGIRTHRDFTNEEWERLKKSLEKPLEKPKQLDEDMGLQDEGR